MRRSTDPKNQKLRIAGLTVLPLVAVVLAGWVTRGPMIATADANADSNADAYASADASANADANANANANAPLRKASAAAVARDIAQKNAASRKDQEAFVAAGWTMVDAPEPEQRLVQLDPALLRGRESELRTQLASTTAAPSSVGNLVEIAKTSSAELSTRMAAVESLGRINGDAAQDGLLSLLDSMDPTDPARAEVAPLLRPRSIDDKQAAAMASRLDARGVTAVEKKQLAFTLALIQLRDGSQLPAAVSDGLSAEARALLDSMTRLASTGGEPAER